MLLCRITDAARALDRAPDPERMEEWLFYLECFALSGLAKKVIPYHAAMESLSGSFNRIGLNLQASGSAFVLEKVQVPPGPVETDLSFLPPAALPYAMICAAQGYRADIRGLQELVNWQGIGLISLLQRELYRFGIKTDFCGRSKLKIYDAGPIRKKNKPVDVSQSGLLTLFFIPLALLLGPLDILVREETMEKYKALFSSIGYKIREQNE